MLMPIGINETEFVEYKTRILLLRLGNKKICIQYTI